jgi:TatD DNase family protein
MKFIDTHTHIYLPEFDADRDEAVSRAVSKGVIKLLLPNIDTASLGPMLAAEARYPGICYPMLGLHPTSVKEDYARQLDQLEAAWPEYKFVAIGEIGIDLYWDKTFAAGQIIALRRQLTFALSRDLPVVIHSRDAFPELFMVLEEFRGSGLRGVLHAFTGAEAEAEKAIGLGFMLGIGGIVTFRNSGLDRVIRSIGADNLVLETDSPYLAPVPHRGKRNESSYIPLVNKRIAEVLDMSEEKIAEITYSNSARLFNLESPK